ncbi:MAG: 3-phosphoserine/phosphohydroxythreonine transaminase [Acidaminococcaceae bacterium]
MERIYNFSAGPAMLPLAVLEEVQAELLNCQNSGMSILEMSHRAPVYDRVNAEAEADIKELLGLGEDYCVLFLGGGASLQFSMVAMNFLTPGKVGAYVDTSNFSNKALKEASKVGKTCVLFSSKQDKYNRVPRPEELQLPENLAYVHITGNNTIEGTEFTEYPETGAIPLIADLSSDILSKPIPAEKFSLIYAGAQKNIGPGGVVVVIARKAFLRGRLQELPTMLNYETHLDNNSLYNTPPVFGVYIVGLVAKWLKKQGGLQAMAVRNQAKAKIVYEVLDRYPEFYRGFAEKSSRSLMNVTFGLPTEALEKEFVSASQALGLDGLKGHRSVGGLRASIYNAMPLAGCEKLAAFMEEFYHSKQ